MNKKIQIKGNISAPPFLVPLGGPGPNSQGKISLFIPLFTCFSALLGFSFFFGALGGGGGLLLFPLFQYQTGTTKEVALDLSLDSPFSSSFSCFSLFFFFGSLYYNRWSQTKKALKNPPPQKTTQKKSHINPNLTLIIKTLTKDSQFFNLRRLINTSGFSFLVLPSSLYPSGLWWCVSPLRSPVFFFYNISTGPSPGPGGPPSTSWRGSMMTT